MLVDTASVQTILSMQLFVRRKHAVLAAPSSAFESFSTQRHNGRVSARASATARLREYLPALAMHLGVAAGKQFGEWQVEIPGLSGLPVVVPVFPGHQNSITNQPSIILQPRRCPPGGRPGQCGVWAQPQFESLESHVRQRRSASHKRLYRQKSKP